MRGWVAWLTLALGLALSNIGHGQVAPKTSLGVASVTGITASWAGDCAAGVLDNRSAISRASYYHALMLTAGTGSWTATLKYSDASCAGPWTAFGSGSAINQASNPAIALGIGYHPYIQITITGNAVVAYSGQNQLPMLIGSSGGGVSFPITVPQGGTGVATMATNCVPYGNGAGNLNCLSAGSQYQVYQAGSGGIPTVGALNLSQSAATTGTLGVAKGGSGAGTFTSNGMLYGNTTSALGATAAGSQYQVFQAGAAGVPTVGALNLSQSAATTGLLPVAKGGTGTATPGLVAGTGIGLSGSWPNQTVTATTLGTVTSVALTLPTWLSVAGSPVTSSGTLAVTAATGQTAHRVVGTCGSGTSVTLCALVVGDLPTGYLYSDLSGAPTIYNQTVKFSGTSVTQEPIVNLIAGSNVGITCVDNSGSTQTDCTFTAPGGASLTIQNNGANVGAEPVLNFIAGVNMSQALSDAAGAVSATLTAGSATIATKTGTYPVVATDYALLCDATSAGFTMTLPASPATGKIIVFKKIDASGNTCTLAGNSKNIDGAATWATSTQWGSVEIQYDGTAWYILAKN